MPELILRHNLHGIDIDPRCAQIAAFALWMRAQRAYNDFGLDRANRPAIRRTNIVVAEPMPGEKDLLKEFTATLQPPLLGQLVEAVFDKMQLAGEAGSLLKIEEELPDAIAKAREQWARGPQNEQMMLFADDRPKAEQLRFDLSGITNDEFWHEAEARTVAALHQFAKAPSNGAAFPRTLFADDAERGLAFIDVCRQRYEVTLMNPPFGELPARASKYITTHYPAHCYNIVCPQVHAGLSRLQERGIIGAIIDKTACIKSSYEKFRRYDLLDGQLLLNVDLGWEVLDSAQVETWCIVKSQRQNNVSGVGLFIDVSAKDRTELGISVALSIASINSTSTNAVVLPLRYFDRLPNASLGFYKLPRALLNLFIQLETLEPSCACVRQGLGISDSWRYYRVVHEIPRSGGWVPLANGGGFAPYYRDIDLRLKWFDDGSEIKAQESALYGSWSRTVKNQEHYFRAGISYPKRTDHLNAHILPPGCIFTVEGLGAFTDRPSYDKRLLGLLNSRACAYLISTYCGQHKHVGYVKKLPVPAQLPEIDTVVNRIITTKVLASMTVETATLFRAPLLFMLDPSFWASAEGIRELADACVCLVEEWNREIKEAQAWIDNEIERSFGFDAETSRLVATAYTRPEIEVWQGLDDNTKAVDAGEIGRQLASYCFGATLGRWDVSGARDLAMEAKDVQARSVLDPLEPVADGVLKMRQHSDGPVAGVGVLVDDAGHPRDILKRIRAVLALLWTDRADEIYRELVVILDDSANDLRRWFRTAFFDDHVNRYSKGRRKAPIYWQLSTPSTSYAVWLYYQRLTPDTFYKVLNDYVKPKLDHEQRKLDRLRADAGPEPTRSQRAEIDQQETFFAELKTLAEEIERIAPLWNPDLNDGVIINFAPLWRLVPQHKAWQKECKACWDKLVAGDYDWAHLAMHLWPERVVPKCRTDASLAIAHGLEDVYWEQDEKGKWVAKTQPDEGWDAVIERLVAERTKPAVKAALKSLLEAPAPAGSVAGRNRRSGRRRRRA